MTVLVAFDFGKKRIGVSVGDTLTRSARALPALANDWTAVERAVREWGPDAFVVGLPLGRDGDEQPITREARAFAQRLHESFARPVHLVDERYTSLAAASQLREARNSGAMTRRVRKGDEDSAAAQLILEQWLREKAGTGG
ncbi:MAG TPA: Holliday junction resolvase RuvX [Candidatus Binatia bacterium]|nr:Holliday junction resolvase RuvX [Candidatus Binatia bacterium]